MVQRLWDQIFQLWCYFELLEYMQLQVSIFPEIFHMVKWLTALWKWFPFTSQESIIFMSYDGFIYFQVFFFIIYDYILFSLFNIYKFFIPSYIYFFLFLSNFITGSTDLFYNSLLLFHIYSLFLVFFFIYTKKGSKISCIKGVNNLTFVPWIIYKEFNIIIAKESWRPWWVPIRMILQLASDLTILTGKWFFEFYSGNMRFARSSPFTSSTTSKCAIFATSAGWRSICVHQQLCQAGYD